MPFYRRVGEVPRKRHARFPRPDGGLYAEELMGEEGFSSSSSLLYHRHSPTAGPRNVNSLPDAKREPCASILAEPIAEPRAEKSSASQRVSAGAAEDQPGGDRLAREFGGIRPKNEKI